MIKAVFIGAAAAAAAIAAEVGTDKVLAMREARSAMAAGRATEARKTHEINVPASRTARSRATLSCCSAIQST
jgi:hypothetical protein